MQDPRVYNSKKKKINIWFVYPSTRTPFYYNNIEKRGIRKIILLYFPISAIGKSRYAVRRENLYLLTIDTDTKSDVKTILVRLVCVVLSVSNIYDVYCCSRL